MASLWLPEAQLRRWLAQFLCDLFLQFMVRCVQRDRQSHSVRVVDLHHHRFRLCSLSYPSMLGTWSRSTFKDHEHSLHLKIQICSSQCKQFLDSHYVEIIILVLVSVMLALLLPLQFLFLLIYFTGTGPAQVFWAP